MATLQELFDLQSAEGLKEKVAAACWRLAKEIFNEDPATEYHASRILWAVRVLRGTDAEAQVFAEMLRAVITVKDTANLSDTEIQDTVDLCANHFATAGI